MAQQKQLGRYELRRVLGKGAMGVVYEGFDPTLGRLVAIKTILKSAAFDEETERSYAARFSLEAKAVARLNHPNIIQVHDFGVENEAAYLVMEFIRGRELRSYFDANEKFSAAETVRIMGELLDALEFAHEAGVIHRDVKPANVMLDAQRRVKLADFGVARIQDSDRSAAGTMVGTPAFMSPEQISGGKIDRRTDLFSAGVVLYQLLTGEQPFKGSGAWTVAKQIMQEEPPQPSSLVSNVSPAFDAIVERALAKAPADRFASAKEFAAALRAALGAAPMAPPAALAAAPPPNKAKRVSGATDAEVEFWRSIQNSSDASEFDFYLEKFPEGTYAPLARHKLAKLRGTPDAEKTVQLEADVARKTVLAVDPDATVAMPSSSAAPVQPATQKKSIRVPALIGLAVVVAGVVAVVAMNRPSAPVPAAEAPVPAATPKTEVTAADIEKIRKETEERIRREYADKSAAEQAAAAQAASDKAIQEKQLAAKAAAEKLAADKAVAEKAAAEKLAAAKSAGERAALEKAAVEKAAAEKAAAEKIAADKAAAEKAAADKIASEKAAAEKAAAAKAAAEKTAAEKAAAPRSAAGFALPKTGDRWVYMVRDTDVKERSYEATLLVNAADGSAVSYEFRQAGKTAVSRIQKAGSHTITQLASGVDLLPPYLLAFERLKPGDMRGVECDASLCTNVTPQYFPAVMGKERVSVPAGQFEAWKVVVVGRWGPNRWEYSYWYDDTTGVLVKYRRRTTQIASNNQSISQPDIEMELLSHTR